MIKRWPESFAQGPDLRPLSLDIHKEVLKHRDENPELSGRVVSEVLKRHTTSFGYLYGMLKHKQRYNLDHSPVADVTVEHRDWARQMLRSKQKDAQKIRKAARLLSKSVPRTSVRQAPQSASNNAVQCSPDDGRRAVAPVIKYKQSRRRLIKPPAERAVDLAS